MDNILAKWYGLIPRAYLMILQHNLDPLLWKNLLIFAGQNGTTDKGDLEYFDSLKQKWLSSPIPEVI